MIGALAAAGLTATAAGVEGAVLGQYVIPATPTIAATPAAIVSGPDGALWFTESRPDRIGRVTADGNFADYQVTPGSYPVGIAVGPDGALWFTEAKASRIGRITTAGVLAEYAITPASEPENLVAGSDGAMWFTDRAGNAVGRVATDGPFAEYPLPTPASAPVGITGGPDGALWFTESGGARIGRIDPTTHGVTEFPAGAPGAATDPQGITVGPDGALWFTERAANKIGRMTAAGALTEFDAAPGPFGITRGRDGALWFTQSGMALPGAPSAPGMIGRLTPAGVTEIFPLPSDTGDSPNDVAAGPDGAIWVTEYGRGTIGRVSADLTASRAVVSGLSMTQRSFRVAVGRRRPVTSFRFNLSTPAAATVSIVRLRPGKLGGPGDCRLPSPRLTGFPDCVAQTFAGRLRRARGRAGRQSVDFTGYFHGRRLPPGRYLAFVEAAPTVTVDPHPRLHRRSITFTILG